MSYILFSKKIWKDFAVPPIQRFGIMVDTASCQRLAAFCARLPNCQPFWGRAIAFLQAEGKLLRDGTLMDLSGD